VIVQMRRAPFLSIGIKPLGSYQHPINILRKHFEPLQLTQHLMGLILELAGRFNIVGANMNLNAYAEGSSVQRVAAKVKVWQY